MTRTPSTPPTPRTPTTTPTAPWESSWEGLVTSALLGTDRRTPPPEVLTPGKDAPVALLDAAVLHTVRRRAGLLPAPAAAPPAAAPRDGRAPLPGAARRRLGQLLADR
ncbi:hypothetical protein ACFXPP_32745, partial [Streptomyces sp. NPDC059134]